MDKTTRMGWRHELDRWLAPFLEALGDARRRRWAPVYVRGLIGPGERKSIQPLAARVAPGDQEQVHHFVATSTWDVGPLEALLAEAGDRLVGGSDAVLIVDDTTLPKKGRHSVGVAHQYSGALGKNTNCQALVSLTLARQEVPVPVALRLFLPEEWTTDPARCRAAGVPMESCAPRTKAEIALEELDRVRAAGVRFAVVLADAGYGTSATFRQALSARGLHWAVGISRVQKVYPPDVELRPPDPRPSGRPPKHPVPTAHRLSAEWLMASLPKHAWRKVRWRDGTKGPLVAHFAAVGVRVADGPKLSRSEHLPGEEVWLIGEHRPTGERKYYLSNCPPGTPLVVLARVIKARWACEQVHQQLKEELGLDHFEGRSWTGLHHHTLLTMIAFTFLQHLRLRQVDESHTSFKRPGPPPQPSLPAVRRAVLAWLLPHLCPLCGRKLAPHTVFREVAK